MRWIIAAGLLVLAGACQHDTSVSGELGRSQDEYGTRYGTATTSPVTPDQVGYNPAPGTRVIARFVDGRSVEELWIIDGEGAGLSDGLAQRARQLVASVKPPVKTIAFKLEGKGTAEVLEEPAGTGLLRVERRAGRLTRVNLCVETAKCRMLDYFEKSEKDTDEMLATAAKALNQRTRR